MVDTNSSEEQLKTAGHIFGVFSQLVAGMIGLSALGYFIGWREASAYYSKLGAPWILNMLPPTYFLQNSAQILVGIVTFSFSAFMLILVKNVTVKTMSWVSVVLLISALFFSYLPSVQFFSFTMKQQYLMESIVGILFLAAAGVLLGEIIGGIVIGGGKWKTSDLISMNLLFAIGVLFSPNIMGSTKAVHDMDLILSPLPIVTLADSNTKWRLVQVVDGNAILMEFLTKESKRQFRVVEAKEIKSISIENLK